MEHASPIHICNLKMQKELAPHDQWFAVTAFSSSFFFTKENTERIKQKLKLLSELGGVGRNIDIRAEVRIL